jgi:hypothetical protein
MITTLRHLLTKNLTLVTLVLVVLLFTLGGESVFAQTTGKADPGSFAGNALQSFLWILVNGVFGLMVGFAGTLLNTAVNGFVIGFGDFYINKGLGATIDSLWVIVRDIFNLTFIFGLVAIGLKMIFNSGDSSTKKMLISLIMAALLVNFSLFITKFVVDFSNIAAVQLVGAFPKTAAGLPDISGHFMQLMGLKGIFNVGEFDPKAFTNGGGLGYIFSTMILFIVTAFVFFAGSILLLIRFAVLNIYMVLSPLMFIGWVFPSASSITSQYWKGFLGRAFFAPAYILMLYFSQKILSTFGAGSVQASISGIFKPGAGTSFGEVMPPFILTIIFLIASIVIAQKMGANGASGFVSMGQNLANRGKKVVTGAATGAARGTFNAATYLPRAGVRAAVNAGGTYAEKKFNNLQAKGGAVSQWNWVDRAARKVTQGATNAQLGTGTTNKAEDEYKRKTTARSTQTAATNARAAEFKKANDALDPSKPPAKSEADLTKALDDLAKTMRDMSKEEKENLKLTELTDKNIAVHLSDSDIENLEKTGKYGAQEIQTIKNARKTGLNSIAAAGSTLTNVDAAGKVTGYSHVAAATVDRRGEIVSKGSKEAGKLPIDLFKQSAMYNHITPAMLEERLRNGVSGTDQKEVRDALNTFLRIPKGSTPIGSGYILKNNPWYKWEDGNSTYAAQFFA